MQIMGFFPGDACGSHAWLKFQRRRSSGARCSACRTSAKHPARSRCWLLNGAAWETSLAKVPLWDYPQWALSKANQGFISIYEGTSPQNTALIWYSTSTLGCWNSQWESRGLPLRARYGTTTELKMTDQSDPGFYINIATKRAQKDRIWMNLVKAY